MLVIGLTGPSGAGKSTVCAEFASFGIPVLDADAIYRELILPPSECLDELVEYFGKEILSPDGPLNRRALAARVFTDPRELEALNEIAHRYVLKEARKRLKALRDSGSTAAVFDAPQLFESGADQSCNIIVSVLASTETRLHRILLRDHISEEAALQRIQSQKSDHFFRTHSDYVIENDLGAEHLRPKVRKILAETGVIAP